MPVTVLLAAGDGTLRGLDAVMSEPTPGGGPTLPSGPAHT